ncbi:hypothetical protein [Jannaschia formosa]|nr:hypothetical protein [Jannaschia formosa]
MIGQSLSRAPKAERAISVRRWVMGWALGPPDARRGEGGGPWR